MTIPPLRRTTIILFWLPLAATWLMMALEGPYLAAIVARMPAATLNLAAYGVAQSLAWLIESPIMMLLSAATTLVRDRASFVALRRFAFLLNALVTVGMLILAAPPVFRFIGETLIGLPADIAHVAHTATTVLILWPAAIGYRRFYQGVLVRQHLTRRVAYGTVIRLGTMSVTAAILAFTTSMPGAVLGAVALLSGVVVEAAASRWMANGVIRTLMASDDVAERTLLRLREIARFYYPLALTSVLSMALGPLVTFGLGRGLAPIESLAVWPVIAATGFIFRSGGVAFQEVALALTGQAREYAREVRDTGLVLGIAASLLFAFLAFTPLEGIWLLNVSGLTEHLASFAVWPLRVLVLLPLLEFVLSIQRAGWILDHRTGVITASTAIEVVGLAMALFVTVGPLGLTGALGGAIATMAGRLAANAWLYLRRPPALSAA